jgi:hypothetical protein
VIDFNVWPLDKVSSKDRVETRGKKKKFWVTVSDGAEKDRGLWLFKVGRQLTLENATEVLAAYLAKQIGIPCPIYRLATFKEEQGVASKLIGDEHAGLTLGNELLHQSNSGDYDKDKVWGNADHKISAIKATFDQHRVRSPDYQLLPNGDCMDGFDFFLGYLLFDAWIANQDRHHENWAVRRTTGAELELAPTFDHAAALASSLRDDRRIDRLSTKDKGHSVEAFAARAKSAIYPDLRGESVKPLGTFEAFDLASSTRLSARQFWKTRLEAVSLDKIKNDFELCPEHLVSKIAISFILEILKLNRERLLALK